MSFSTIITCKSYYSFTTWYTTETPGTATRPPPPPCSTEVARASFTSSPAANSVASQAVPSPRRGKVAAKAVSQRKEVQLNKNLHILMTVFLLRRTTILRHKTIQQFSYFILQLLRKITNRTEKTVQNPVCVDCYVGWHKTNSKKRKRDPDY